MDPILPNPLDQERALAATQKTKDIYSSSHGEIFSKNFVAGFARALGGIVVYLIFLGIITFIISRTLLPQLLQTFGNLTSSLNSLNQTKSTLPQLNSPDVQQLFQQLTPPQN